MSLASNTSAKSKIFRFLLIQILAVFVAGQALPTIYALSATQKKLLNSGIYYFDAKSSFCNSSTVVAGDGSPEGSQFPNLDPDAMANAIDSWVIKQNSRTAFKGLGSKIVASAKNANINPFLVATIARKESFMADPEDFNVKNGNNSFGRTATSSQPNFQGARLWYRWSSVEASIDYTAPENQNISGGGDIASYIRSRYADQLNDGDLVALFMLYAPPGENDTELYIAQIKAWISELVNLSRGNSSEVSQSDTIGAGCSIYGVPAEGFVYYAQNDPQWANYPYGSSTVAVSGCGPTSVAMVVASLADKSVTPKEVADFGSKNGAYIPGKGSSWQAMLIDGPQNWGLKSENIGLDMPKATRILQSGGFVIATGAGLSPFSRGGHIIVLRAVNTDGNFLIGNSAPGLQKSPDQIFSPDSLLSSGVKTMFGVTK